MIVTFEETGEQRAVKSVCARCAKMHWVPLQLTDVDIVSRNGIGHVGDEYGMTLCGIDATGDRWWHKL